MLTAYAKQEDVPEALREHYSKREDGKWHADIPDDHPAVRHNAKLLSEKQTAEDKAKGLQADLDSAKASTLPRGHVAVARTDAELLEKVKAHGTPQEIETKLTGYQSLKDKDDRRMREDSLREVAKELKYNPDAFMRLSSLPDFEIREVDGKKSVIAKVKQGDTIIEKPAQEYIEGSADIAPFLPALKTSNQGIQVHGSSGASGTNADPFAAAREFGKQHNEAAPQGNPLHERFGIAKSA